MVEDFTQKQRQQEEDSTKTLRQRDEDRWAAQKKRKREKKDAERRTAKANGHKMGRWVGGGALCKNGSSCSAIIRWNGFGTDDHSERDATKIRCVASK